MSSRLTSFYVPFGMITVVSAPIYLRILYVIVKYRRSTQYSSFYFKMCLSQVGSRLINKKFPDLGSITNTAS